MDSESMNDTDGEREVGSFIPTFIPTPAFRRYAKNYNLRRILSGMTMITNSDDEDTDRDNTDNETKILEKISSNDITIYDSGNAECSICMDTPKTHVIVPCGHYCACLPCSLNIQNKYCPMCRTQFDSVVALSDITEPYSI